MFAIQGGDLRGPLLVRTRLVFADSRSSKRNWRSDRLSYVGRGFARRRFGGWFSFPRARSSPARETMENQPKFAHLQPITDLQAGAAYRLAVERGAVAAAQIDAPKLLVIPIQNGMKRRDLFPFELNRTLRPTADGIELRPDAALVLEQVATVDHDDRNGRTGGSPRRQLLVGQIAAARRGQKTGPDAIRPNVHILIWLEPGTRFVRIGGRHIQRQAIHAVGRSVQIKTAPCERFIGKDDVGTRVAADAGEWLAERHDGLAQRAVHGDDKLLARPTLHTRIVLAGSVGGRNWFE